MAANASKPILVHDHLVVGMTEPLNLVVGVFLVVLILGAILMNGIVCMAFVREKSLRQPGSYLLVNLSIADLMVSAAVYPTSIIASFLNTWPFGDIGCTINGFGGFVFNASNMITMALLAIERYYLVCRPIDAMKHWTKTRMYQYIAITWIYVTVISLCPLFGWSRYVPEPYGLSCTVDWFRRTPSNVSYVIVVFVFIFFLPVIVMIVCYSKVVNVIVARRRATNPRVFPNSAAEADADPSVKDQEDYKKKVVIPTMISCALVAVFLVCWTPYAVISFIGLFKSAHSITDIDTYAIAPTFAKTACFLNPLIYGMGHGRFRQEIKRLFSNERVGS